MVTERGGQVTFHGPGQIVVYPLIDLRRLNIFVKEYVFRLEAVLIQTLERFGVTGFRVAGRTGIYVRPDAPAPMPRHRPGAAHDPSRLAKIAGARHQGQPALQLPRPGAPMWRGPGALPAHQPVWVCGLKPPPFDNLGLRVETAAVADVLVERLLAQLSPLTSARPCPARPTTRPEKQRRKPRPRASRSRSCRPRC